MNTINSMALSGQYQTRFGTKKISQVKSYNEVQMPKAQEVNSKNGKKAIRKNWLDLKYGIKKNSSKDILSESILKNAADYRESLQNQRQQTKTTAGKMKKLRYHFKSISSKILKSKTSIAARQAVGQARREVTRLSNERQKGEYDPNELELAISHAKAMERVARKKVKHLLEEEMAKAANGFGTVEENDKDICKENKIGEDEPNDDASADEYFQSEDFESEDELIEENEETQNLDFEEWINALDSINLFVADDVAAMISETAVEMLGELEDSMREILEELGLEDLTGDILASVTEMDADDYKMMKIKHRNNEMKDVVKADADYLKGLFKSYQEANESSGVTLLSGQQGETLANESAMCHVVSVDVLV